MLHKSRKSTNKIPTKKAPMQTKTAKSTVAAKSTTNGKAEIQKKLDLDRLKYMSKQALFSFHQIQNLL